MIRPSQGCRKRSPVIVWNPTSTGNRAPESAGVYDSIVGGFSGRHSCESGNPESDSWRVFKAELCLLDSRLRGNDGNRWAICTYNSDARPNCRKRINASRSHDGEVDAHGEVETFRSDFFGNLPVRAVVANLQQQVARLTGSKRPLDRSVVRFDQIVDGVRDRGRSPFSGAMISNRA